MPGPSVFSPVGVRLPNEKRPLNLAWSHAKELPLLAVAIEGGSVLLFREDGESFEDVVIRKREGGGDACVLRWSPRAPGGMGSLGLAIGWEDGTVSTWSEKERKTVEDADQHAPHAVSFIHFSPDSGRMITGDARSGGPAPLVLWKVDTQCRINTICVHRRASAGGLTHAVFRTTPTIKKAVTSAFAAAECPPHYFGGELGVVCCGNDMGVASDVVSGLGAPLSAMEYNEEHDLLVLITRASVLAVFRLTGPKPTQLSKVKLSMGKDGLRDATWAGGAKLAVVSADHLTRVTDMAGDENDVLSLTDVPALEGQPTQHATCVAHQSGRGLLAVGTREGKAVVWRGQRGQGLDANERAWEPLAPADVPPRVAQLAWGPTEGVVAARCESGLCLLRETVLGRVMHGRWVLMQLGAHKLRLEHASKGGATFAIETKMRVRGVALHANTAVAWSGTHVELWTFDDGGKGEPERLGAFECKAHAVAIWGESLYLCVGSRVEVADANFR